MIVFAPSSSASTMESAAAARDLDSYEQMLGLCSTIKLLSFAQKNFLHLVLGQLIREEKGASADLDCSQLDNDASVTDALAKQPLDKLTMLLCFLKPEHAQLRHAFAKTLQELCQQFYTFSDLNKRQFQLIMSLAKIHPAFSEPDRQAFFAMTDMLERGGSNRNGGGSSESAESPTSSTSSGSLSPLTSSISSLSPSGEPDMRSASVTFTAHAPLQSALSAPVPRYNGGEQLGPKFSLTVTGAHQKAHRSLSSSPSAEESPSASVMGSSNSLANMLMNETFLHTAPLPGMRDVPLWLKGLRLHKYSAILGSKSYEELLSVNEEQLELWNVTKGARHKIAVSIQKLRERPEELLKLAKQLNDVADIRAVLLEIRNLLSTPMKATSSPYISDFEKIRLIEDIPAEDLAGRISFIIRKVANIRLRAVMQLSLEDDCINLLIQLADRCIRHEAFYGGLRTALQSIKHSLQLSLRPNGFHGHRKVVKSYTISPGGLSFPATNDFANGFDNRCDATQQDFFLSIPEKFADRPTHRPLHRTLALTKGAAPTIAVPEYDRFLKPKMTLSRTRSAPVPAKPLTAVDSNLWFDGIDPDLDALTLSVTEHALDSFEQTNF